MRRDLASVIAKIQSGSPPPLMLFFGDDLQVQEACKTILDLIVPEDARAFNLERFDGHTVSWDQIEASIMTPPFFPGRKLLWVENAPYFFSREQKGELGAKVLQLWNEGNRDEASKLLADWLVVEGWTQEQWEGLDSASLGALPDLLAGDDQELKEAAEGVLTHGRSRGVRLHQRREGHGLHELLDRGFPPWSFLLMTAIQVDRRTRLYKRLEEIGAALNMELERDRGGKISRETLIEFIDQRLRQAGKSIEPRAREMILARAGHELRGFAQELEKLLLYVGDRPSIQARDIATIVADQGEGWIFDLTRSIADRNVAASLSQLGRLLAQGEHPLKLLGTLAGEVRKLIAARQLIDTELSGWHRGMNYQQFQKSVLKQGAALLTRNPYADYMCFQRADHFFLDELIVFMRRIFEADLRLKSTGSNPRLLMERLVLAMCLSRRPSSRTKAAVPL
jgi:DNA polymerase-3 subunit delta